MVFWSGELRVTSESSPDGQIQLSMPFQSANLSASAGISFGTVAIESNGSTLSGQKYLRISEGTSQAKLYLISDGGTPSSLTQLDVDTDFFITFSVAYRAA
jgi:hypothetical protein